MSVWKVCYPSRGIYRQIANDINTPISVSFIVTFLNVVSDDFSCFGGSAGASESHPKSLQCSRSFLFSLVFVSLSQLPSHSVRITHDLGGNVKLHINTTNGAFTASACCSFLLNGVTLRFWFLGSLWLSSYSHDVIIVTAGCVCVCGLPAFDVENEKYIEKTPYLSSEVFFLRGFY